MKYPNMTKLNKLYKRASILFRYRKKEVSSPVISPFGLNEMKEVPEGWKVKGPDFVGISSARAGTTWWYTLLLNHPQVEENRVGRKELSYFYPFKYK